jgi:glutaminyl-tRNA synthetase
MDAKVGHAEPSSTSSPANNSPTPSHFIRKVIEDDLAVGTYRQRRWSGYPADAATHAAGNPDPAAIRTRFPPEPNGYLHLGHAKSIWLNFGLAKDFGGVCHMRFDDTNPEKEEQEFVDGILDAVHWLGYGWDANGTSHLYHASDYFDFMYRAAEYLIQEGLAYVDEQTAEEMRFNRGDFTNPGKDSPFRNRSPAENLARFQAMRRGELPEGAAVLRARIDMASPNINMRDPAIYRIKHAEHHNTGSKWCIYPMYTYAHPIEDALENITHSICTLEFEDQRPFYDWLLEHLRAGGLINSPPPRQYEFARLNTTYVITSKRRLKQLVDEQHVDGWDDPRMPTLVGLRRRGFTPASIRAFVEATGVSKAGGWVEFSMLEQFLRDDLDPVAPRAMAVVDPLRLVITNWPDSVASTDHTAPLHPHQPDAGVRRFTFGRDLWIERDDFREHPEKGYHRLYVGNQVRLKYGYIVRCTGYTLDANGRVNEVQAEYIPESRSGTATSGEYKAKGVITWVHCADALPAEFRLYDRLFLEPQPDAGGKDFLQALNPASLRVARGYVEPSLGSACAEDKFQFERVGYFVADRKSHSPGRRVFNRISGLKDSFGKS